MKIVVCVKYVPDAQADRTFEEADNTTDRDNVDGLLSELDEYAIDNGGRFPTPDQGLRALVHAPTTEPLPLRWKGPYVTDEQVLSDAWQAPFYYTVPGKHGSAYELWSLGSDRAEGGEGSEADFYSYRRDSMVVTR